MWCYAIFAVLTIAGLAGASESDTLRKRRNIIEEELQLLKAPRCNCPATYEPVCALKFGTWRTFDNGCIAVTCARAKSVQVGSCKNKKEFGSSHRSTVGGGWDQGCSCPRRYDPVCGSDGHTYDNEDCARCFGAAVAWPGICDRIDPVKKRTLTRCVCSPLLEPVCATDGLTYANADCAKNCGFMPNVKPGKCENACPECGVQDVLSFSPVCDSNRVYYYNECYARCFSAQGHLTRSIGPFC